MVTLIVYNKYISNAKYYLKQIYFLKRVRNLIQFLKIFIIHIN